MRPIASMLAKTAFELAAGNPDLFQELRYIPFGWARGILDVDRLALILVEVEVSPVGELAPSPLAAGGWWKKYGTNCW